MKLIASAFHRHYNCPGGYHLQTGTEELYNPFATLADFGRRTHSVAEAVLLKERTTSKALKDFGFKPIDDDYDKAKNAASYYVKYVNRIRTLRGGEEKTKLLIEEKYRIVIRGCEYVAKGDAAIVTETDDVIIIDVFDLKTGNFDYSGSAFSQLQFGLYVMAYEMNTEKRIIGNLHIVQPNFWQDDKKVSIQENIQLHGEFAKKALVNIADRVNDNKNLYLDGDHCTMCPVIYKCPKVQNFYTIVDRATAENSYELENVSNEKLEYVWKNKKRLTQFINAVEQIIEKRLESGERFESIGYAPSFGHRVWKDKDEVEKVLKAQFGDDIYDDKKLKSPARMEKIIDKELLKPFITKPVSQKLAELKTPFDKIEEVK